MVHGTAKTLVVHFETMSESTEPKLPNNVLRTNLAFYEENGKTGTKMDEVLFHTSHLRALSDQYSCLFTSNEMNIKL